MSFWRLENFGNELSNTFAQFEKHLPLSRENASTQWVKFGASGSGSGSGSTGIGSTANADQVT